MMRKHTLRTSLVAASLFAGLAACDNDKLTSVNANPNQPESVQSSALFTNATTETIGRIRGVTFEHGLSGLWDEHYAEIQYPEADLNQPRNATTEGLWSGFYAGELADYTQILRQSASNPNQAGPALVMRAFSLETMTDLWGDIPFSDAEKGASNLTPKYDTQAAIYDTLFASLTKAASTMNNSPASPGYGAADPVYGGDSDEWIKLANSLHARAALRLSQVDKAKSTAELTKALSGNHVFQDNSDNAFITWPGGAIANPLCLNWVAPAGSDCGGQRDDQRLSERFVDTLLANNDPRIFKYADSTTASLGDNPTVCDVPFRGYPNGHSSADVLNPCSPKKLNFGLADYSRPNKSIRQHDSPSYIMTYAEVLFIRAEAAERGMVAGDAAQLYKDAITASMQQWKVDQADIDAYLARPSVQYKGGTPAALQQIAYEKWVALFNMETEAYAEYRRLDFPVLKPGPEAVTSTIPTRLPYPDIENSLNQTNLKAANAAQGSTDISGKVWWDKP